MDTHRYFWKIGLVLISLAMLTFGQVGPNKAFGHNLISEGKTVQNTDGAFLAVVDVYVTNRGNSSTAPPFGDYNYTGLTFWDTNAKPTCTVPYRQDLGGSAVIPSDVNYGIGGDFTYIWVKYDWVLPTAETKVLVDIAVHHWPNWNVYCPEGWEAAHGDGGGKLTTRTDGACWRNGLCVLYKPMNQTDTFISNLSLSRNGKPEARMPSLCPANGGFWVMKQDEQDIHQACGDDYWYYIVYNQARKWPALTANPVLPSDTQKFSQLSGFAPLVWHPADEPYYPSSVEWAFTHLNRVWRENAWWLWTKESLKTSDVLEYFHGCDGSCTSAPCKLSEVPVYAFWDEVDINVDVSGVPTGVKVIDLIYYLYYPYNRGKELLDTIWGNHVSDWEHVSIRMVPFWSESGDWSYKPAQVYLSAHDFGRSYLWEDMVQVPGDTLYLPLISKSNSATFISNEQLDQNTISSVFDLVASHPVVYEAWGSHGIWKDPGAHVYQHTPAGNLTDYTSAGVAWKTWQRVEAYTWDTKAGLSGNTWPVWMGLDYTNPSLGGDYPGSGPIYRWGNDADGTCYDGECQLNPGPSGPVDKSVWDVEWLQ